MPRFLQAILFDLGDTLMYSPAPWQPVLEEAGRGLASALADYGLEIDEENFPQEFRLRVNEYYAERDRHLMETSVTLVLQDLLREKHFPKVPEGILRFALDEYYAITQQNWQLEEDALPMLRDLQGCGYRMGIVSNAGDEQDVFQLVQKFGIQDYFDFVLTSAACSYRKPHPRIYQVALAHWGYMPDQAAMVGDRLDADIGGSQVLGVFGIWNRRRARKQTTGQVTPDATVTSLSQIPPLLAKMLQ
jgi:HAD superfamily hydrolase (TIGR01662 family)